MKIMFDIVPTHLAIIAMRDSGYKNAAYAIAELVDNAIQAKASEVEIICKDHDVQRNQRLRKYVKEIAIIDNGSGMSAETLRKSLQFGNGERLQDRSGIGRFGMGLPNSSISQCKHVDVWSWQDGVANAIYSYLDLSEIQTGGLKEIPEPKRRPVPQEWIDASNNIKKSKSGTIIVWRDLDKCEWKTAQAIFRNSEFTIGRIYRKYIHNGKASIRMASFNEGATQIIIDDLVEPNDPTYLMEKTSVPGEWGTKPVFEPYGDPYTFKWDGHNITITLSIAKKEAREGHNPGELPHGKHASNNIGVSIMRADRELELQTSGWVISYDTTERWWGAEVDFPPALDEIFGVPNNKQGAIALADIAKLNLEQIAQQEGFNNEHELIDAWNDEKNPRLVLIKVKQYIESNLRTIRSSLKAQTSRANKRYDGEKEGQIDITDSAETKATEATKRRREEEGIDGGSDKDENKDIVVRETDIAKGLEQDGLSQDEAKELAQQVISDGRKYEFYDADLPSPEFFTVRTCGGVILIGLNTNHPAYDHLVTLIRDIDDETDINQLKTRMRKSFEALKLLLEAWARYEDELPDGPRKVRAQESRFAWGIVAREFFRND